MSAISPSGISPLAATPTALLTQMLTGIPSLSTLLSGAAGISPFVTTPFVSAPFGVSPFAVTPSAVSPTAATAAIAGNLTAFTAGLEVGAVLGASVANNLFAIARTGVPSAITAPSAFPTITGIPGITSITGIPGVSGFAGFPGVSGVSIPSVSGISPTAAGVAGLATIPGTQTVSVTG